ncbi:CDP-glucose 4,6-dehydratase, partial [Vibrio anguillarum]|nr:CDP-glucose 4,6-dehydratase [Vibrio anguillarum]
MNPTFWHGKKVFITGHTGFKGGWLSLWLQEMGAIVKGYSLPAPTTPSLFEQGKVWAGMRTEEGDIRDFTHMRQSMYEFKP